MIALALALQTAAAEPPGAVYFGCVRTNTARLAASKESADVVAEAAVYACRDLLRAAALANLPPPPAQARGRRGNAGQTVPSPAPDGPLVREIEQDLMAEARRAAILAQLEEKTRRK